MRKIYGFLLLVFLSSAASGQLLPSIGIGSLPNDNDSVCLIPIYTGSFDNSGYFEGDTVNDFTLYDLNGDSINLASALSAGKPVLLVGGSYTCPVFRGKINDINNMAAIYGTNLNIYIVYTVEAHPVNNVSPYSGNVWVPSSNYTEGVLFEQPDTYGQRKAVIDSMLANYIINVPVLLDGPCNNWWLNYGPAPNNACLIDTNGIVFAKHPWFDRPPDNMYCDIDSLLGMNSDSCVTFGNNGTFSFVLTGDSSAYGPPGQTLDVHATLTNLSSTDNVLIDIIKRQINLPAGWQSAICADICYAATTDSVRIVLSPNQVQPFTYYFYTDSTPSQGWVRVLFRNVNNTNNRFGQTFLGYTNVTGIHYNYEKENAYLFPNPFHSTATLQFSNDFNSAALKIYNAFGTLVKEQTITGQTHIITRDGLSDGIYFIRVTDREREWVGKMLIE
jgi:hypothetical protein